MFYFGWNCVNAIIITCDAFKSMIADSVDFVSSYTFEWPYFFLMAWLNAGQMGKVKFLLKNPGDDQQKNKEKWC